VAIIIGRLFSSFGAAIKSLKYFIRKYKLINVELKLGNSDIK
jgi:hypothetical protein